MDEHGLEEDTNATDNCRCGQAAKAAPMGEGAEQVNGADALLEEKLVPTEVEQRAR